MAKPLHTTAGYRITPNVAGGGALRVPPHIHDHVPGEARFIPEMTEDGILYRLVRVEPRPDWAKAE